VENKLTVGLDISMMFLWESPRRDGLAEIKEYDAKIDMKRRVTLRGARYDHYHVREYEDGRIELEPRELVAPFEVSKRTLDMMDKSIKNLRNDGISGPIDLSNFNESE